MKELDINKLIKETSVSFSRSSGKGGQNVNKVETRAELTFNLIDSKHLSDEIKSGLLKKLKNKLDSRGNIRIVSQTERTQLGNRKKVIEKFIKLIEKATEKNKIRVKTDISSSANEKRLKSKKLHSRKKKIRSEPASNFEFY